MKLVEYKHPWIKIGDIFMDLNVVSRIDLRPRLEDDEADAIEIFLNDIHRTIQRFFDLSGTKKEESEIPQIRKEIENLLLKTPKKTKR